MYSSSMGSIQAAIKKLIKNEYIQYEEMVENGKYKKVYSITESGKQHFLQWVNTPMEALNIKNPELAKIYFMGLSDKNMRAKNIEKNLANLNEQYQILKAICEEGEKIEIPDEGRDILNYQLASAKYGKELIKFNIDWYTQLLSDIRSRKL